MPQNILDLYRFEVVKTADGYLPRCVRKHDNNVYNFTRPFCVLNNAINELKIQKKRMQEALDFKEEVVYTLEE